MGIRDFFATDGPIARIYGPGYQPREQQVAFSEAVYEAMSIEGGHLMAEAPTGVGKSFGYLVPAAIRALDYGERTLIVTKTKHLQDQLYDTDLPLLRAVTGGQLAFEQLKGKINYLCLDKFREALADKKFTDAKVYQQLVGLRDHDWKSIEEVHGDLSRYHLPLLKKTIEESTRNSETCTYDDCKHYKTDCFYTLAKARTLKAHIVVVNQDLFLWHVFLKMYGYGQDVAPLGDFASIVLDESHSLPDKTRDFFEERITRKAVLDVLKGTDHQANERSKYIINLFFDRLQKRFDKEGEEWLGFGIPENLESIRDPIIKILAEAVEELRKGDVAEEQRKRQEIWLKTGEEPEEVYFKRRAPQAESVLRRFQDITYLARKEKRVYSIERNPSVKLKKGERPKPMLRSIPVSVGPLLDDMVWSKPWASICVSATLSVRGSMDFFRDQAGFAEGTPEIEVESPFDFEKQSLLVIPRDFPRPDGDEEERKERTVEAMVDIITAAGGRTLCLFTSHRALKEYGDALKEALPYEVLTQSSTAEKDAKSKAKLIERFKKNTSSVLLGTDSFWEGVDVKGEACSCVIIEKFPFPSRTPFIKMAKYRLHNNAFPMVEVPRMIMKLKQGIGRAIRTVDDRCVVVVLDPRFWGQGSGRRNYSEAIRASIPSDLRIVSDLEAVKRFFEVRDMKPSPAKAAFSERMQERRRQA